MMGERLMSCRNLLWRNPVVVCGRVPIRRTQQSAGPSPYLAAELLMIRPTRGNSVRFNGEKHASGTVNFTGKVTTAGCPSASWLERH